MVLYRMPCAELRSFCEHPHTHRFYLAHPCTPEITSEEWVKNKVKRAADKAKLKLKEKRAEFKRKHGKDGAAGEGTLLQTRAPVLACRTLAPRPSYLLHPPPSPFSPRPSLPLPSPPSLALPHLPALLPVTHTRLPQLGKADSSCGCFWGKPGVSTHTHHTLTHTPHTHTPCKGQVALAHGVHRSPPPPTHTHTIPLSRHPTPYRRCHRQCWRGADGRGGGGGRWRRGGR